MERTLCAQCGHLLAPAARPTPIHLRAGDREHADPDTFCSWRCLRDYAQARMLFDTLPPNDDALAMRYLSDWAL